VKAINDWRFNVSLQIFTLPKGSYTIVVDPIWNDCAKNNPEYQQIVVNLRTARGAKK
jgi:hypothetical protein